MRKHKDAPEAVAGPMSSASAHGRMSSNRSFGLVLAGALAILGCWPLVRGEFPRWWALLIAACFLVVAIARPRILAGLNRWWTRLGVLLGNIVGPIAMAIVYYLAILPVGLIMRCFGKDAMGLRFRRSSAGTYWVVRDPRGRPDESMKNQF